MANPQNLTVPAKGEVRNPNGRPKGSVNRKTILNYLLFEADIEQLGIIKNKPDWWGKVKPRTVYEVMTVAMAAKAMSGDTRAFNALNKALGEYQISEEVIDVMHMFVPQQVSEEEFNKQGIAQRERMSKAVEAELTDEHMEGSAGATDYIPANP